MARSKPLIFRLTRWTTTLVVAASMGVTSRSWGQYLLSSVTALDVPVDARSIGMGESFSGVPGDLSAVMYNPAGLSDMHGVQASYSFRSLNWLSGFTDFEYHSAALAFSTPLFAVGILYTRADQGNSNVVSTTGSDVIGAIESHSDLLAVGVARPIVGGLSCGLTIKGFTDGMTVTAGDPGLFFQTYGCFLVDIGAMYTLAGLMGDERVQDSYSAGISLQNFGSDLREQMSLYHIPPPPSVLIRVPRYFRLGVSCTLNLLPSNEGGLDPVRLLLSGGYRNLLNPTDYQSGQRDFWGWGVEATAYEMVILRMGGYIDGVNSIYGPRGVPALRYGAGIAVPMARLGASIPLTLRFDFAAIPIQQIFFSTIQSKSTLTAVTFGVAYDKSIF